MIGHAAEARGGTRSWRPSAANRTRHEHRGKRSLLAARRERRSAPMDPDPLWYKDAVFYELPVKAFADSNGDGMGDFPGLTAKLDYLVDLGVDCIWLLPINPSPFRDDGYD